jgi:hypothetical protein
VRGHGVAEGTAAVALYAWCGWASGFHRTTPGADISWLVTTVAVAFGLALWRGTRTGRAGLRLEPARNPWPRPGRGGAGPAVRGLALWLGLIFVIVAWDRLGIDTGPHQYHLTISALAQAHRPLNAALLLIWVLVGVGYAQRASARQPTAPMDGHMRMQQGRPTMGPRSPSLWGRSEPTTVRPHSSCRRARASVSHSG